jgi:hypothetical protein
LAERFESGSVVVGCLTPTELRVKVEASAVRLWKARWTVEGDIEMWLDARSNGLAAPCLAKDLI